MKRIFKKLRKLFPGVYIEIRHRVSDDNKDFFSVYIMNNSETWIHNWSDEFSTLKELENHLKETILNYN